MTNQQIVFVDAYLSNGFNATEAAKVAGYSLPNNQAWRVRNHPEVAAEIECRLSEHAMSANEVLARLGDHARATVEDFVDIGPRGAIKLNLAKAQKAGKLHLVKGIEYSKTGKPILHLHDAQSALVQVGRHHKLFTDKTEVDISDDALELLRSKLNGDTEGA